jgi:hypothetical protein
MVSNPRKPSKQSCNVSFCVLFVCKCVLYYCHRVLTQLQLTNISCHVQNHASMIKRKCDLKTNDRLSACNHLTCCEEFTVRMSCLKMVSVDTETHRSGNSDVIWCRVWVNRGWLITVIFGRMLVQHFVLTK